MMLLPALAFALSLAQGEAALQAKVTYATPAKLARVALEELSKLAGMTLAAPKGMANEMLVLRFKDVPLQTALDKIAAAANAHWDRSATGYDLVRGGEEIKRIRDAEHAKQLAAIRKAIAARVQGLKPFDAGSARALLQSLTDLQKQMTDEDAMQRAWPRYEQLVEQKPSGRLITRVLAAFNPEALADLPLGRVVFATNPTRMQRPLDARASTAVQQFLKEQSTWADTVQQLGGSPGETPPEQGFDFGGLDYYDRTQPKGTPAKMLVVVQSDPDSSALSFEVILADAKGQYLADSSLGLPIGETEQHRPQKPDSADAKPIQLSAPAKE